ncbi:MAG: hypothetical protein QOC59_428 [Microbacteriaceae bacterium]|nr:hypothetical protein [Microbacteriaceae bacterium]
MGRMDLTTVAEVRVARSREDIVLSPTVVALAGGTWLFSERQDHLTGLVDLTGLGWTPWERRDDGGLSVAATCTIAELVRIPPQEGWTALPLFRQSAESLLQSFKIWNTATIGGNLATGLAAGALIGLGAALDADAVIWTPDGGERVERVADLVVGQQRTTLRAGEVIRSVEFPPSALAARTAFRRIALSPLGRAGTVVAGRRDADGGTVLAVTGGTTRPEVIRFPAPPSAAELGRAVERITTWFTDAHGAADWRRAMTGHLAEQVRTELR